MVTGTSNVGSLYNPRHLKNMVLLETQESWSRGKEAWRMGIVVRRLGYGQNFGLIQGGGECNS